MSAFYTIISANTHTADSVGLGLIFSDGTQTKCYVSPKKEKIALRLLGETGGGGRLLKIALEQIKAKCSDPGAWLIYARPDPFEYLHRYSNGLLGFSAPSVWAGQTDEAAFARLAEALLGEGPQKTLPHIMSASQKEIDREMVLKNLVEPLCGRVHTGYVFSPENLPGLSFSFDMDCIGLNGALLGARFQDFDQSKPTLDKHLNHYLALISVLSFKFKKSLDSGLFFLIAREPEKIAGDAHKVWEAAQKNELLTILPPEEAGRVTETVFEKKATLFLS